MQLLRRDGSHDEQSWGLRRSARLFDSFRYEHSDPPRHYKVVAEDFAADIGRFTELSGKSVLDVGGGPGFYAAAIRARGARYVPLEYDVKKMKMRSEIHPAALVGDGLDLPVRTSSVDICCSSNVLEHVSKPWQMADEMVRIVRPGGTIVLSFTNWLSPHGGHETAPWHFLGGEYAAQRYEKRTGKVPQNRYGSSLFSVSVRDALRWADGCQSAEVVAARPRYYPEWAAPLLKLRGAREVLTWNLLIVLRRHSAGPS